MSSLIFKRILAIIIICTVLSVIYMLRNEGRNAAGFRLFARQAPIITVAAVACGQRLEETTNLVKSVLTFHRGGHLLKFVVVTEESLKQKFHDTFVEWQKTSRKTFLFEVHSLSFPSEKADAWKKLFKPCAAQRLFLPSLLKNEDAILYLDTDTLLLSPVSEIWDHFKEFNSSQLAALSPEHEDKNVGWYNRFARHPFYGPMGVNSGVMLMNLTRMREFKWEEQMEPLLNEYRLKITWGDQDLINILFFFHPDKLFIVPCIYNYRPDHCMYLSICNATDGIRVLHGNRGYFHSNKQPIFNVIYKAILEYNLQDDPYQKLIVPLEEKLLTDESVLTSNCGKVAKQMLIRAKFTLAENKLYA